MRNRNIIIAVFLLLGFSSSAAAMLSQTVRSFPSLPTQYRDNKFNEVRDAFEERAKLFLQGRQFHNWKPNRQSQEITEEFKHLDEWRYHTWYSEASNTVLISRPDFMIAQDLLEKGYYKRPHLIAFQYNQADSNYNSSIIVLNGQRFLAMEAPTNQKLTSNFFKLLQNFQVTQLVRLTQASENGIHKSIPYWLNRIKKEVKTGEFFLNAPFAGSHNTFPIRYYATDRWQDNRGIDSKTLLDLIQDVRKQYDPNKGLMACHCSAGVGRTGTFLAGFILLQEIDRQIAAGVSPDALDISIEKVVLQLSLQRFHMVSRPAQYVSLYRLVDLYIAGLKK